AAPPRGGRIPPPSRASSGTRARSRNPRPWRMLRDPIAAPTSLQETRANRRNAGSRIDAVERPPPAARAQLPADRRAVPGPRLLVRLGERGGALPQPGVTGLVPPPGFHRKPPQPRARRRVGLRLP